MKHTKTAAVLLAAFMSILPYVSVSAAADFPFATNKGYDVQTTDISGNGTLADPYIANDGAQLAWAFKTGGYVRLGQDISADGEDAVRLEIYSKEVYLDLAGHTYNVQFKDGGSAVYIAQGNALYISDSGTGGTITTNGNAVSGSISSKLHINGGRLYGGSNTVFMMPHSSVYFNKGALEGDGTVLYLKGADLFQTGGIINSRSADIESAVAFDSYYDSGNGNPSTNVRIGLYLRGGIIDRLYIPFSSANISAEIRSISLSERFGCDTGGNYSTDIFKDDYTQICSSNLLSAINAASDKRILVEESCYVHQNKGANAYFEITNDITPVLGGSIGYPTAPDSAHYSFGGSWYGYSGEKLSGTFTSSGLYNAYTLKGNINAKSSSDMFMGAYLALPNIDRRLCEYSITKKSDTLCEYLIKFPMTPAFSQQPKDKADVLLNSVLTFKAQAINASTYKWHLTDFGGNDITFEQAAEYGLVSVLDNSQTTDTLKIKVLSTYMNGFGVYCEAYGNGAAANSAAAKISFKKPEITVQPLPAGTVFNVNAVNADRFEWCLKDEDGTEYTWEQARENGWGYPRDNSENTQSLKLFSIGKNLEGKTVYCKVYGNGYTINSNSCLIGGFKEVTAHINAYGLQIPFPGKEFGLDGIYTNGSAYELESIKLCHGRDAEEVTSRYIDFFGGEEYYYLATFVPKQGWCFTENSIASGRNINGICENGDYRYTGNVKKQLTEGKIIAWMIPTFVQKNGYENTRAIVVNPSINSLAVRNFYDPLANANADLAAMGAPNYTYSLDGTNWYTFPEINGGGGPFGGLAANTEYTVYFKNADTGYIFKTLAVKTLPVKGDTDENGRVEKADAKLLMRYLAGISPELSKRQETAAKMNDDDSIDMLDVIEILKICG